MQYKPQIVGNSYNKRTAKSYLKIRTNTKEWRSEQQIVERLLKDLPDGIKVLDIPFGTGRFVNMYLEKTQYFFIFV